VVDDAPMTGNDDPNALRHAQAVLDGEICCLGPDGRSRFYDLMFRRE
jgi:hypothetical protein